MAAVDSYGLRLAESVRFPPSIVPKAKLIYRDLKEREERENVVSKMIPFSFYDRVDYPHDFEHFRSFNEMANESVPSWRKVWPLCESVS